MSWLQSGHHAVSFFPLAAVTVIYKTTQECASDAESMTLLSSSLTARFCSWRGEEALQDSARFHLV